MKFARLVYQDKDSSITKYTNVGDWFQTFAVDNLYQLMNIQPDDIIEINRSDLKNYNGEKAVLVMQGWFNQLEREDFFPLSPNIVPIFLGFHRLDSKKIMVAQDELIGCRDEKTFLNMKKLGYNAFVSGCLTITLPRRSQEKKYSEVFFVDVPNSLFEYVPEEILINSHKITQEIVNVSNPEEEARKLIEWYRDSAKLVVTSRLHCAAPCLGMGIPVILVRKYFDDRYGWIDKWLKLYTPDKFSEIDWEPEVIDIREERELLLSIFEREIFNRDITEESCKLSNGFLQRERTPFSEPSIFVRLFWEFQKVAPKLSNFIRYRLLRSFTVIGNDAENM